MVKKAGEKKSKVQKKHIKNKTPKKKTIKKRINKKPKITKNPSELNIEKTLIENFVALQKVMTNLSIKFDNLSNNISKLLEIFEISAKALAEKNFNIEQTKKDDTQIIKKLDELQNQNKIIARGLTLMHEGRQQIPQQNQMQPPKPIPNPQMNSEYQKSISNNTSEKQQEHKVPMQLRKFPKLKNDNPKSNFRRF